MGPAAATDKLVRVAAEVAMAAKGDTVILLQVMRNMAMAAKAAM